MMEYTLLAHKRALPTSQDVWKPTLAEPLDLLMLTIDYMKWCRARSGDTFIFGLRISVHLRPQARAGWETSKGRRSGVAA
jgi:hypothetical protein